MQKKIIRVDWVDSSEWNGWHSDTRDMSPSPCTTVGYLMKDCKSHIVIASSLTRGCSCSHMCIPRGAITKITELKNA